MSRLFPAVVLLALTACDSQPASNDAHAAQPATAPRTAPAASSEAAGEQVVATVGGLPITLAEVDKAGAADVIKARQDMYNARAAALDGLVREKLVDAEAKARGTTSEELLKAEIDAKIDPVTDQDVADFYAQNQQRMRGTLEQMAPQIKGYLEMQKKQERMMAFVAELEKKTEVNKTLDPPRIDVAAGDSPRFGSADAPVEIIEFSDFQCPYCTRGAATLDEVKEKYGDKVTVVYRHFPLDFHDRADRAAQASECANDQDKFWPYHDQLFANQSALQEADLVRYAKMVELDVKQFEDCMATNKHAQTVQDDLKEGAEAGMSGTPGFFINGRFVGGAQPIQVFSEIIDEELARNQG